MHKLHLRASAANSLAAEEQMKLAHQVMSRSQLLQTFLAWVTSLSVHKRLLYHVLNTYLLVCTGCELCAG